MRGAVRSLLALAALLSAGALGYFLRGPSAPPPTPPDARLHARTEAGPPRDAARAIEAPRPTPRRDASVLVGVGELGVLKGPVPAASAAARGDGGAPPIVRVPGPPDASAQADRRMDEGAPDAAAPLDPPPPAGPALRVQGRVLDERGMPVPGARVDAGGRELLARKDGSFTLTAPTGATVRVEARGYPEARTVVRGAELEVTLRPGGGIEGQVIDQATGMRRMDFSIEARGPGGASRRARASGGLFRLLDLAPGPWTLRAEAAGRVGTLAVDVPAGARPGELTLRDVQVPLSR